MPRTSLVVTTINPPNAVLQALAGGCAEHGWNFLVVGDAKSPATFQLPGARYLDLEAQRATGLAFAGVCPTGHYARKNVGFLVAIRDGAEVLVETDDDNHPRPAFFATPPMTLESAVVRAGGWVNLYRYFTDAGIWPRGLPLDAALAAIPPRSALPVASVTCPIQQGLADEAPDVDAVYRLLHPGEVSFDPAAEPVALGAGAWCPFNSQNTVWHPPAFPLLYLPATCSFRMTDIWRGFVAQRLAAAKGWHVLFRGPTVVQQRNPHDLLRDFADEVPGYLHNRAIAEALDALPVGPEASTLPDELRAAYRCFVDAGWCRPEELQFLDAWLADLAPASAPS
jgi:hypothetical protein